MQLPTLSPRRLASVAAVAAAAALTPVAALAATASAASPAAAASTPPCTTSGLVAWLDTHGGGYAGGTDYYLAFTNLSGHACTLRGYPGVSAISLSGRQIGSPAGWGPAARATTVTLTSGATATAGLQIADAANYGTRCLLPPPWQQPWRPGTLPTAAGLRVYPPNQFTSKVIPYPFPACAHPGPVYLQAGPVTPGYPPD